MARRSIFSIVLFVVFCLGAIIFICRQFYVTEQNYRYSIKANVVTIIEGRGSYNVELKDYDTIYYMSYGPINNVIEIESLDSIFKEAGSKDFYIKKYGHDTKRTLKGKASIQQVYTQK